MTVMIHEEALAYLESMNRSLEALIEPLTSDSSRLANMNIQNCKNWLKAHGIAYFYDGKTRKFRLKADESPTN